jgi:hypothetical protein
MRRWERRIIRSRAGQAKACQHSLLVTGALARLPLGIRGLGREWGLGLSAEERWPIERRDDCGKQTLNPIQPAKSLCGDWHSCEVHQSQETRILRHLVSPKKTPNAASKAPSRVLLYDLEHINMIYSRSFDWWSIPE